MLNGPVYFDLVRKLWAKAYVFDRKYADNQEAVFLSKYPDSIGFTIEQMGLEPFKRAEIRSTLLGMKVVITQAHIAKLLKLDNTGKVMSDYTTTKTHQEAIKTDLFEPGSDDKRVRDLKNESKLLIRIMQTSMFTRNGGTDTTS
jgi:hypothetical protein